MNKRFSNIIYCILITAYVGYIALPLVHYHQSYFGAKEVIDYQQIQHHFFDPFSSSNSECSLNQIVTNHINEVKLSSNNTEFSVVRKYYSVFPSNISLQVYNYKFGLKAPPAIS